MISKIFFILIFRMSRDVRRYLRNPDKLFRRVRDKHGNLRLSKAAKAYHSGRGVYRSSYRNALRLTATENNMAYRTADHLRWQQQPFVVGIEIKLSNNHTCKGVIGRFVDICDDLAGVYPKDFKFVGWHPHCRCYCVPKQASKEEFMDYQQRLLNGEDVSNYHFKGEVKDLPRNFKDWYTDNTDRIARAKSQPYFLRDNQKLIETLVTTPSKQEITVHNNKDAFRRLQKVARQELKQHGKIYIESQNIYSKRLFFGKEERNSVVGHCFDETEINAVRKLPRLLQKIKNGRYKPINTNRLNYKTKMNNGMRNYVVYEIKIEGKILELKCYAQRAKRIHNKIFEHPYSLKLKRD